MDGQLALVGDLREARIGNEEFQDFRMAEGPSFMGRQRQHLGVGTGLVGSGGEELACDLSLALQCSDMQRCVAVGT